MKNKKKLIFLELNENKWVFCFEISNGFFWECIKIDILIVKKLYRKLLYLFVI